LCSLRSVHNEIKTEKTYTFCCIFTKLNTRLTLDVVMHCRQLMIEVHAIEMLMFLCTNMHLVHVLLCHRGCAFELAVEMVLTPCGAGVPPLRLCSSLVH